MNTKPRLVSVDWDDVTGSSGVWKHDSEIDAWADEIVFHCTSVGWLIREEKDFIVLAARATAPYLAGDTDGDLSQIGDLTRIPRVLITKVKALTAQRR